MNRKVLEGMVNGERGSEDQKPHGHMGKIKAWMGKIKYEDLMTMMTMNTTLLCLTLAYTREGVG